MKNNTRDLPLSGKLQLDFPLRGNCNPIFPSEANSNSIRASDSWCRCRKRNYALSMKRLFDAVERRGDVGREIDPFALPISNRPRVTSSCAGKTGLRQPGEHTSGPNLASRDNVAHSQTLYTILETPPPLERLHEIGAKEIALVDPRAAVRERFHRPGERCACREGASKAAGDNDFPAPAVKEFPWASLLRSPRLITVRAIAGLRSRPSAAGQEAIGGSAPQSRWTTGEIA